MQKRICFTLFILLALFSAKAFAQTNDNTELKQMAEEDQKARMTGQINWAVLNKEDSLRRIRVFELLKENKVQTANDYLNSGIIFQHGNDTIASGMAVKTFKKAIEMNPALNRWWYAAAVDRDLMRKGKPQIYGTQYIKNKKTDGKWLRYEIDTTQITDEQRKYYSVETLKEQEEKLRQMNLIPANEYAKNKSINKLIEFIITEHKKGIQSQYNVGEEELNSFGYQLIQENKINEALSIFKLNIQLFPDSWNTYDSYGEALLKVNKKKEAVEYYKKSLKLNPDNENAKKVLKEAL